MSPKLSLCLCLLSRFSHFRVLATPWTVVHQAPLAMGYSRQEHWSGLSFPPPEDLPDPGIELVSPASLALAGRFFTTEPPEKSLYFNFLKKKGIYFCDLKSSHFIACYFFLPPLISFFSQVFIESLFCGRQVLGVQWWYTDLTLSSQILDEWGRPVSKYSRAGCLKIQC